MTPTQSEIDGILAWIEVPHDPLSRATRDEMKPLAAAFRSKVAELEAAKKRCETIIIPVPMEPHDDAKCASVNLLLLNRAKVAESKLKALEQERDRANAARLSTEKDLVRAWALVDELRDALSFLRVRILEVYSGPSPMLDEAWEKSRKALAKETYEYD